MIGEGPLERLENEYKGFIKDFDNFLQEKGASIDSRTFLGMSLFVCVLKIFRCAPNIEAAAELIELSVSTACERYQKIIENEEEI